MGEKQCKSAFLQNLGYDTYFADRDTHFEGCDTRFYVSEGLCSGF